MVMVMILLLLKTRAKIRLRTRQLGSIVAPLSGTHTLETHFESSTADRSGLENFASAAGQFANNQGPVDSRDPRGVGEPYGLWKYGKGESIWIIIMNITTT